ncbi:MAG: 2-dehydropantoate 2-reductase N-terminal domain-containing protein [Thermoleophilia bacterium]
MRHAVLGAGGIGGLVAAALARSGGEVILLLRPESLAAYPGGLRVESVALGNFEVDVPAAPKIDRPVDVLWVAVKATHLERALPLAPPELLGEGIVVPLLNGVDHLEILRQRYPQAAAAAIRVESERAAPGLIRQKSPFLRIDMAGAEEVQAAVRQAGIDCHRRVDEATLLWEKLVFLAPIALATSAFDAPLDAVRDDPLFSGCRTEAASAANAAGAAIEVESIRNLHEAAPAEMQSSMQKDVAAGVEPELAAIAGPILRVGQDHGLPTSSTHELVERITARLN